MRFIIYGMKARLISCCLILFMFTGQPVCAQVSAHQSEIALLNDRSADIIGSFSLQAPGLIIPEGLTGKGVIVGMADSGLDKGSLADLPLDLQSTAGRIPRVVMLKSFSGREIPDDPIGHGTHMAGTIVGSGESSDGQFKGIAPGASLYFQGLLDKDGKINLPSSLQNLYLPAYLAGVRIHINGWGEVGANYGVRSSQSDQFIYEHPDFLAIFGAGNQGPGRSTLTGEASSKNVLTVGSSQSPRPAFSPEAVDADLAASSSSRGPTSDGRIKPELIAPGSAIISVCSRLTESNFSSNQAYTRLGGSSMATSVTGGAAALLMEYLKSKTGITKPSSALLKALLINGARTPKEGPSDQNGFGILDLAGTILPLEENSVKIAEIQEGIKSGANQEFRFQVSDPSRAFKATLTWVDAVAETGSGKLVDNLNLEVVDPSGKVLRGNDFKGLGVSDSRNNVEQIIIDKPLTGEYVIRLRAPSVSGELGSNRVALVFGQTMRREVVKGLENGDHIILNDDSKLNLSQYNIKACSNGRRVAAGEGLRIGSDIYISSRNIYAFSRNWDRGGVQIIQEPKGNLLVEINPQARQGGYYIDKNFDLESMILNGGSVDKLGDIPAGVKVSAQINPRLQTVWTLAAFYRNRRGVIESVDQDKKQLRLLLDPNTYQLTSWTAVSTREKFLESPLSDAAYGSFGTSGLESLSPSTKVTMMVASSNNEVQSIVMERDTLVGNVVEVDSINQKLKLDNGKTYSCFPGAKIYLNGQPASLKNIHPGDKISACLLGDNNVFIQLQAFNKIIYGRIVYLNSDRRVIYLFDTGNNFTMLNYSEQSEVYKGGLHYERSLIASGDWARLVIEPSSGEVIRFDLAEKKQEKAIKYFKDYNLDTGMISFTDGSSYNFALTTQMTKGGYRYTPDLLFLGEKMEITTLECAGAEKEFLAQVEVEYNPGTPAPDLQATCSQVDDSLLVRGYTTADRIMVFREDGSSEKIPVNGDGTYEGTLSLIPGETKVLIMAVDLRRGGIIVSESSIQSVEPGKNPPVFTDIDQSPDRTSIEYLAEQGVVSGVDNDSFRPSQPATRAEFVTIVGQAEGWAAQGDLNNAIHFKDNDKIPFWALDSVYFAYHRGIIGGYPDGTFRPEEPLTRIQMMAVMSKILAPSGSQSATKEGQFTDETEIPEWALPYYNVFQDRGWLSLFGGGTNLEPNKALTREEAARFIRHILFPAANRE